MSDSAVAASFAAKINQRASHTAAIKPSAAKHRQATAIRELLEAAGQILPTTYSNNRLNLRTERAASDLHEGRGGLEQRFECGRVVLLHRAWRGRDTEQQQN